MHAVRRLKHVIQSSGWYNLRSLSKSVMAQHHMERTSENSRNEIISLATVIGMRDESKTVKSLTLKVEDKNLTFKAGQWLDMFIPGVDTVGGFSMCSSPCALQAQRTLDLAVKYSKHPPAHWIHTQCKEGSQVKIRIGGDFYYDPATTIRKHILLVAGGVGINPLISILHHALDLSRQGEGGNSAKDHQGVLSVQGDNSTKTTNIPDTRVMLLYSARNHQELIFMEQLGQRLSKHRNLKCQFHVTQESPTEAGDNINYHRIGLPEMEKCFDWLRKDQTTCYVCGPSSMITDVENWLVTCGLEKSNIKYEKWW